MGFPSAVKKDKFAKKKKMALNSRSRMRGKKLKGHYFF